MGHALGSVLAVMITVGVNFVFLYMAPQIVKLFGNNILEIIKRLVGLFLAILAMQIMIGGVTKYINPGEQQNLLPIIPKGWKRFLEASRCFWSTKKTVNKNRVTGKELSMY